MVVFDGSDVFFVINLGNVVVCVDGVSSLCVFVVVGVGVIVLLCWLIEDDLV